MKIQTFGAWESPISPEMMAGKNVSLAEPKIAGDAIYWLESRPWEQGRSVLVVFHDGKKYDLLPDTFSIRSRAQEYGGGAWALAGNDVIFINEKDQVVYRFSLHSDQPPVPLTSEDGRRYADFHVDRARNRVLAVCEDHRHQGREPVTSIVAIQLDGSKTIEDMVGGDDFYAYPRLSTQGDKLSWIAWNHPHMPWQATKLMVASLDDKGRPRQKTCVIEEIDIAVFQPNWSPDDELIFVADFDEYWNLYCWTPAEGISTLTELQAECGLPLWNYGMSTWACADKSGKSILCCINESGSWRLVKRHQDASLELFDLPFTQISSLSSDGSKAVALAASPLEAQTVVSVDTESGEFLRIHSSASEQLNPAMLSRPVNVDFPTSDNETAYGFFYSPTNADFQAPEGTKPPLIVLCHGGPTSATSTAINLKVQFWTSRGFAVMDINYRGSTGYGKSYRHRLNTQWGIADVADACNAAQYAVQQGWVDPQKLIIRGSSAGGFTVLAALTFGSTFTAGCCIYGIGDLQALAEDTHKFESRYLDSLVAAWPEHSDEYQRRSPLNHIEQLSCPVIFFQGLLDKVVPPEQTLSMAKALHNKGIPTWYQTYTDEGHGFRTAAAIVDSYERELAFYAEVLNFPNNTSVRMNLQAPKL